MLLKIFPDAVRAAQVAADELLELLERSAVRTLMLPGGNTPLPLYAEIARRCEQLERLRIFALDEYVGVPRDHPRTCANLLREQVVRPWKIPPENFHTLDSTNEAAALKSLRLHEQTIAQHGGIDLLVLGLGQNGHLGFNEPGSEATTAGRLVELQNSSIEANRQWFRGEYAPRQGITVGVSTLLRARHIFLLAFGGHKRSAVTAMVKGRPHASCPASWLQGHPDTQVYLDEAAAEGLSEKRG